MATAPKRQKTTSSGAEGQLGRTPTSQARLPFPKIDPFEPFERRFDFLYGAQRPTSTVTVGGQTYRGVDNGRANVLVPVDKLTPAQRAARERDFERLDAMRASPAAGTAYGLAALAGASPQTRDRAIAAGLVADAGATLLSGRGVPPRQRPPTWRAEIDQPSWRRPNIRYRELNADSQPMGVNSTLTTDILGTGTRVNRRLRPPGWSGNGRDYNEARAHLQARQLGGSGRDPRNIVTLTQKGANHPQMSRFENAAASRVRAGEVVEYSVLPSYTAGVLAPTSLLLTALGSRGRPAVAIIGNPAARRK